MYHAFREKKEEKKVIQKQKTEFIGYLVFTGRYPIRLYKQLCNFQLFLLIINITKIYHLFLKQQ